MFEEIGLTIINTDSYGVEMELERLLQSSFPNPGDKDKIRHLILSYSLKMYKQHTWSKQPLRRKRDSFYISYFNDYSTKTLTNCNLGIP